MVDELLSAFPHQLSFSEAGMRIMITSHFSPRTRLTMASRMLIAERQRLINTRTFTNGDSDVPVRGGGRQSGENGMSGPERGGGGGGGGGVRRDDQEAGNETENEDNENNQEEEEEEAGACNKLKWLLAWPLCLLLYFTVPDSSKPRWDNYYMLSFFCSTLWIAGFSYIMVWMPEVNDPLRSIALR
ncbi:Sodium/potassium/calcium exchanger 3 [Liparis tanakae]|uniref:Sodium/potassium/calcium exchanger 3 n=1 Tax=Liparis tanakae TaxID=230148 RepID=A0A4Z2EP42_9TELE|nr:Sodium/potassium/calcium exchanger 3 [Liparis tanakae]